MAKAKPTISQSSENPDEGSHKDASLTFEQVLEELEGLVESMESDQVPLGELIENYEKGTRLYEQCQQQLDDAQRRVDLIRDGVNSSRKNLVPFEENSSSIERNIESQTNTEADDGQLF